MTAPKAPARVAVVGAGATGLALTLDLARRGLKPVLFDAKLALTDSSRAICISRRSLEIFRRLDMTQGFFDKALPWTHGKTYYRDHLVFELEMATPPRQDCFSPFVNLQLFYTEDFLLQSLLALGPDAAEVRWGHRITGLSQDSDGVSLQIEGPDGPYTFECDWLAAADGGRSAVRTLLGKQLQGSSYEGRYLIADIRVENAALPVERLVWFDPASNPDSTVIMHVQADDVWRIDFQVDPSNNDEELLDEDNLVARIQSHLDMMGVTDKWEMLWKTVYGAHALSMDSYRDGRVFFAGDAAHLVPIFGVRGLNSGIDDAHNLGWKLAHVATGRADDRLLDSFTEERRAATLENLANAIKSTWFMSPPHVGFEVMRDAVLQLAGEEPWARALINPRQSAAHTYRRSSVIAYDGQAGAAGVEPGAVIPSLSLHGGGYLQDRLAFDDFSLLIFAEALPAAAVEAAVAMASAQNLTPLVIAKTGAIADDDGVVAQSFAATQFPLYLVRPDGHVAARFASPDADALAAAVKQAQGYAPSPNAWPFLKVSDASQLVAPTPLEAAYESLADAAKVSNPGPAEIARGAATLTLAHKLIDQGVEPRAAATRALQEIQKDPAPAK